MKNEKGFKFLKLDQPQLKYFLFSIAKSTYFLYLLFSSLVLSFLFILK